MAGLHPGNGNASAGGATSVPPSPGLSIHGGRPGFIPLVTVVDFHHARGPEVEKWFGVPEGTDPAEEWKWPLLPFMALSDGAHASTEDFSYFTLLRPATDDLPPTSLFGISCTRQLDASQLLVRPADVTRSTVQKAVVVIADSPQYFGMLRERLSVVTSAWFAQREFSDCEILRRFQESLKEEKERGQFSEEIDRDQYLGMNLRELVHEFRWQTLVLLKCCLLQPKMLFFGARCERLCMMQFSLISLIPGLLRNLQDCAGPELDSYEKRLSKPTSLKTSDRNSLLAYMGLPLQIFGKGSLLGPYTPLQQLDILADKGTKSYIVGSTNSLLLQQRDRYSDILINLDDSTINITSPSLRAALALTASDRRWIDFITQEVNDTWDERNPAQPNHMGYRGSEEFIRLQFEEYLLSLISSVKYHNYLLQHPNDPKMALPEIDGDPAADYGYEWVECWSRTDNYRMWNGHTDSLIFDIVVPKHPCAGGLTMDDVQRRIQQQVQDMHLDERFAAGREVLGRNAAAAREKASTMFNKFYADMETMREAQRKRAEETKAAADALEQNGAGSASNGDANKAAAPAASSVGAKAGAYIGSWASWAGEKRKQGWGGRPTSGMSTASAGTGGGGGGWGFGVRKWTKSDSASEKNVTPLNSPGLASPKFMSGEKGWMGIRASTDGSELSEFERPGTQHSFGESVLDAAGSDSGSSSPVSQRKTERSPSGGSIASRGGTRTNLEGIDEIVAKDMASITATASEEPKDGAAPSDTSKEKPVDEASTSKGEPKEAASSAKEEPKLETFPAKEEEPKAPVKEEYGEKAEQKAEKKPDTSLAEEKIPEASTKEDTKGEALPIEDESDKEAPPAKGELEEDSAAATDAWKEEAPLAKAEPKKDSDV